MVWRRALAGVALLVACDQSGTPAPPLPDVDASAAPPVAPVAPDCSDVTDAYLEYVKTCSCRSDAAALARRFQNECELVRLAPGAIGVATALDACAQALRRSTAGDCNRGGGAICTIGPGTRRNGEPCGADAQCASGRCSSSDTANVTWIHDVLPGQPTGFATGGACGTCRAPSPSDGQSWQRMLLFANANCCNAEGALGATCDDRCPDYGNCTDPLVCSGEVCVHPVADGTQCNACGESSCARGSACGPTCGTAQSGTCAPGPRTGPPADGEPCTATMKCDAYAQCIAGTCTLFDPRTCN